MAFKLHLLTSFRATLSTSSHIQDEIHLPSQQLVSDELDKGDNGCLLGEVLQLLNADISLRRQIILGPGDKDSVLLHVAGVAMVASVGDLP